MTKELTVKDLIDNDQIWKIEVTKGTKATPVGVYSLYVRNIKAINTLSYKTAFSLLSKGKAIIIK